MMWKQPEYFRPKTLEQALQLLARQGVRSIPIAGGTQVVAEARSDVEALIDLAALPLDYIRADRDGIRLGSMTRLHAISDSPELRAFAGGALPKTALQSGSGLLRNQGTLGGAVLTPGAAGELGAALLVLDAEVLIQRHQILTALPLAALYEEIAASMNGAILTEVRVRAPARDACFDCQRVSRSPAGPPILAVAALTRIHRETIIACRIAVAGAGPRPRRLLDLEVLLSGLPAAREPVSSAAARASESLDLRDDTLASAEYRRSIFPVLVRRAVLGQPA